MQTLHELMNIMPQCGQVEWIGLRPARNQAMESVTTANAIAERGLEGDRYKSSGGKRQVTLIQAEHLDAVKSIVKNPSLTAATLRRNIVVSGLNLLALKDKEFTVGGVHMIYTGLCHPCSRMEAALGPGGYNAMRGHGGINAKILSSGPISVGDDIYITTPEEGV